MNILRRAVATVVSLAPVLLGAQAASKSIPTPESAFGFTIGSDGNLVDYEQSIAYFRKLAAASSNRMHLLDIGRTSFGRTFTVAVITSPDNWAKLDTYRQINMKLAHPANLTDSAARALARQGKIIVDISGGLHASEIAGSQHTPQLAYEILAHATEPATKEILDNVIFFLWPTINPDGQDIVVKACRENAGGRGGPSEPYEKYMGHDNNRDSYMMNGIESRTRQRIWREWEPDIIYVHHQSSPFPTRIWIPPFADPIGQRAPPIVSGEINTIGTFIAQELIANGQHGPAHMLATFDAYYPGYIDYMPVYQNIPAWWTETQGGGCATTSTRKLADLPDTDEFKTGLPTALYVDPWNGDKWSLRDAVDVMVTASKATLRFAAKFHEDILYNRYKSGRDQIRLYATKGPFAYIIPQKQVDPVAPVELLRRFAFHGIRISQTDKDAAYDGVTYPKGTWVIPMDQEFASLVQEVFEVQRYPEHADDNPYDAAGWTLPFQMGVNVIEATKPLSSEFRASLKPVPPGKADDWKTHLDEPFTTNANAAGIVPRPGGFSGAGDQVLLDPAQNNTFKLIARATAAGGKVSFRPGANGAARYVVSGVPPAKLDAWAAELWVTGERTSGASTASPTPRIGLGNEGMAWTEWLFDTYGIPYTKVSNAELGAGNLIAKYDVLVLPAGLGGGGRGGGGRGGRGGAPAAQPAGDPVKSVDEFVRAGGTVLVWGNAAAATASALQLPVKNATQGLTRQQYTTGGAGSIFEISNDLSNPVTSGMPQQSYVFVSSGPAFSPGEGFNGTVFARYPATGSPLRSGFLTKDAEKYLQGQGAGVDVKHGSGHVVLLSFNPNWRGQPTGSFRLIFNTLYTAKNTSSTPVP